MTCSACQSGAGIYRMTCAGCRQRLLASARGCTAAELAMAAVVDDAASRSFLDEFLPAGEVNTRPAQKNGS